MNNSDYKLNKYNFKINIILNNAIKNNKINKTKLDKYFDNYKIYLFQKGGSNFDNLITSINTLQSQLDNYISDCKKESNEMFNVDLEYDDNFDFDAEIQKLANKSQECMTKYNELSNREIELSGNLQNNKVGGSVRYNQLIDSVNVMSNKMSQFITQCKNIKNKNKKLNEKEIKIQQIKQLEETIKHCEQDYKELLEKNNKKEKEELRKQQENAPIYILGYEMPKYIEEQPKKTKTPDNV